MIHRNFPQNFLLRCIQWMFPKIMGAPKSSILIGFSIINHPFWGTIIFGNMKSIMPSPGLLPGVAHPGIAHPLPPEHSIGPEHVHVTAKPPGPDAAETESSSEYDTWSYGDVS